MAKLRALSALLLLLAALLVPQALRAQPELKSQLDQIRSTITAIDKDVQANINNDAGLIEQRGKLEPLLDQLRGVISEQTPRLEGIKARLEQLGRSPMPPRARRTIPTSPVSVTSRSVSSARPRASWR